MRVALALNGSRGDVQPGVAVALALSSHGHDVTVGVPENLVDFARAQGVEAESFAPDTDDLLKSPLIKRDLKSRNPQTRARAIREVTEFGATTMDDRLLELSDGADLVVTGLMGQERGATVAEYRRAAFVPLQYCPVRPSRSVPVPVGALSTLAGLPFITEGLWRAIDLAFWLGSARRGDIALRQRLGMVAAKGPLGARLRRAGTPEIQAYDPGLFPSLQEEWGDQRPMTGFLSLPEHDSPDSVDEVAAWAQSASPPVYVGFGSMPLVDPVTTYRELVAMIRAQGRRVIVCAGPNFESTSGLFDDDDVLVVRSADHAEVLPRCAAAIHHGGAGTTGACTRAGLPTLIAAFGADQPIWGRAITDTGLGSSCTIKQIGDKARIESAISLILQPEMANRTRAFARAMIDPTNAVDSVAEILEQSA